MARGSTAAGTGALGAAALAALAACNFQVSAPTYIHQTKLIAMIGEVESVGPLNPVRVGGSGVSPLAEAMPGDNFAFDAVVVDEQGRRLPADELDSLWFQCGDANCYGFALDPLDPRYDEACDALDEPSLDAVCRLAQGNGRTSFVVNPIGLELTQSRIATFYGVIAWNGGSAEACWEARKLEQVEIEDCAFIHRPVKVGPSWWMLAYADGQGLESPIPIVEFPAPVYSQLGNRAPLPHFSVFVDDVFVGVYPETNGFAAARGSSIRVELAYDTNEQLQQTYYVARQLSSGAYWFTAAQELITHAVYSTQLLHVVSDQSFPGLPIELVVDEFAQPRDSRLFVVYSDERYGEALAQLDFEIAD